MILRVFLLLTLILAVGFLTVNYAQQSTTTLTGEWVGNSEPSARSEFLRFSLTENAGDLLKPLKAKVTLVQLGGDRVRIEVSSIKLVMTGTLTGDEIEGAAEVPGTKPNGYVRLKRFPPGSFETMVHDHTTSSAS